MPPWLAEFRSFTLAHALVVLIATAAIAISCYHGRTHRETPREARFRRAWGWSVLATQAFSIIYWMVPANFDIQSSLPLHICDLAGIIAGLAMLTLHRPLRTLLYFWGIALSTQAFITPVLQEGPGSFKFWLFWITHLQIVGSAVYDLVVGGYRPFLRDYLVGVGLTTAYAAMAVMVNLALDTNYGYLGSRLPAAGTALDLLPPWPGRLAAMALGTILWISLFYLVWPLARGLSGRGARCPDSSAAGPKPR
jgi:hypothetical integral membrane protein (TIGR02206 family)